MNSPRAEEHSLLLNLLCFLFPALLAVAYLSFNFSELSTDCLRNMDRELSQLAILQAQDLEAYTGAFSRYEFRHPGPFHFYFIAAVDFFLPHTFDAHLSARLAALLFHILTFGLCLVVSRELFGSFFLALFLPLCLTQLTVDYQPFYFLDYWNPNFVPSVFLLFLFSCYGFAKGYTRLGILAVLSASIAFQAHLGTVPLLAPLFAISSLSFLLEKQKEKAGKVCAALLLGLSVLIWLPALYDALHFENGGNIGRLLGFFSESRSGHSLSRSIGFLGSFLSGPFHMENRELGINLMFLFAVFPTLTIFFHRDLNLAMLPAASFALSIWSSTMIHGPMHKYLLSSFYATLCFCIFASLIALTRSFKVKWLTALAPVVPASLLFFFPPQEIQAKACPFAEKVESYLEAASLQEAEIYKLVLDKPEPYRFLSAFALAALKAGHKVCVEEHWGYRYGDALRCSEVGTPTKSIHFKREAEKSEQSSGQSFQSGFVSMRRVEEEL